MFIYLTLYSVVVLVMWLQVAKQQPRIRKDLESFCKKSGPFLIDFLFLSIKMNIQQKIK